MIHATNVDCISDSTNAVDGLGATIAVDGPAATNDVDGLVDAVLQLGEGAGWHAATAAAESGKASVRTTYGDGPLDDATETTDSCVSWLSRSNITLPSKLLCNLST